MREGISMSWYRSVLRDTVSLDFDQPFAIYETLDFYEGVGRPDGGEELSVRARRGLPRRHVGQHDPRPDDCLERKSGIRNRVRDDSQATHRLPMNVAGAGDSAVRRDRRSARNGQNVSNAH